MKKLFSSFVFFGFLLTFLLVLNVPSASAATYQITNDEYNNAGYQLNNGKVVWNSCCGAINEIFLTDVATQTTTQITNNDYTDDFPQMSDGKIVWRGFDGGPFNNSDVFLYDIASGTTTQIFSSNSISLNYLGPKISDGNVAWGGSDNNQSRVRSRLI